jgi:hypothetical protein
MICVNFTAFICGAVEVQVAIFCITPLSVGEDYLSEEWLFKSISGCGKSTLLNIMLTSMQRGLAVFVL